MTRLSELLNQEGKDSLATSSVKIGNVYLIKIIATLQSNPMKNKAQLARYGL